MTPKHPLVATAAVEDYMRILFRLHETGSTTTTQHLAHALRITSPSVTNMTKRLHNGGLVVHRRYHGVDLTDSGRRLAIDVIRRHRLLELLLVTSLGYPWDRVHEEADRLEHSVSLRMAHQIDEYLGHPHCDPHGAPIPDDAGDFRALTG